MGYVEKALADNERIIYRTRQHIAVLVRRAGMMFFAFLLFLAIGLAILLPLGDETSNTVRLSVGIIALISLIVPILAIIRILLTGARGRDVVGQLSRPALVGILILAAALFLMFRPDSPPVGWAAIAISLLPLLLVIQAVAQWQAKQYIITTRRVVEVEGITDKHIGDSALEKVNDIELDQSLLGRMMGWGHVEIITGSDIGVDEFYMIRNPVEFKRAMLNAKADLDTLPVARDVQERRQAGPQRSEIPELIAELALLHKEGVLSDQEFEVKKKELLNRL